MRYKTGLRWGPILTAALVALVLAVVCVGLLYANNNVSAPDTGCVRGELSSAFNVAFYPVNNEGAYDAILPNNTQNGQNTINLTTADNHALDDFAEVQGDVVFHHLAVLTG